MGDDIWEMGDSLGVFLLKQTVEREKHCITLFDSLRWEQNSEEVQFSPRQVFSPVQFSP